MFFSWYEAILILYQQHTTAVITFAVIYLMLTLLSYVRLFQKAGVKAWQAWIPFWNEWCLFRLAWGDGYFCLFEWIPYLGFVFRWIMLYKLCLAFGREDRKWIVWMLVAPVITRLLLVVGEADYIGPEGRNPEQNPYRNG